MGLTEGKVIAFGALLSEIIEWCVLLVNDSRIW